ncbi:DUF2161 family putative PD-(D/E)XK-type phosphodiesterase [Mesobacillus thioparans]|uniref:DUF2161 family putative PD-(D/E)XK-type phosphodiesterase n=1 Tax=Mesobacillus thioparans TaxID=370439 RepID=UPI0039EF0742
MTKLLEADLYEPIRKHFTKQGYRVNGEVHDCDLTAVKDDELIIVELKLLLNIDLLLQATRRLRLTDMVYIAIPKPKRMSRKRWNDVIHLVKRLEIGLIIVSFAGNRKSVEFKVHPEPFDRKSGKNRRKKAALIKEIEGRSADYNIGGSNKSKIMTAYKENCIQIACYLERLGQLSPKALAALGTGEKTPSILQKNYYKWFERVERGIYVISDQGKADLKDYPELVAYYSANLEQPGQ